MAGKHRAQRIAQERIDYLYSQAHRWMDEDRLDDARTAIDHLRSLATKHVITIPRLKKTFCKQCSTPLVAGKTCRVRIKHDRRIITCNHCGAVKRLGLT